MRSDVKIKSDVKFKFIKTTDPEYEAERMLRWEVLRKPLGMPPGSEELPEDQTSVHLVALKKKAVIGCVVFHPEDRTSGRVDQMVLGEEYQAKGFGRKLLHVLEEYLMKNGYASIYCVAREEAIGFYERLGFLGQGEPFLQHGISHLMMKKNLPSTPS